jgi:hypothetical protein
MTSSLSRTVRSLSSVCIGSRGLGAMYSATIRLASSMAVIRCLGPARSLVTRLLSADLTRGAENSFLL